MKRAIRAGVFSVGVALVLAGTGPAAQAETVLRLGSESATGAIPFRALEKLAEYVKQKTKGEYTIRIFPAGQLGPVRETMQQLKMTTLDLSCATNNTPTVMTEGKNFNATAAPFVFRNNEEYRKFLDSPLAREMDAALEKGGVKVVAYVGDRAPRALTTTNKPVRVPADMKGMKVRVPPMKSLLAFFHECGANPTPLPFTELFMALQTGVVDAQDNGLDIVEPNGFYDVQKYYMKLGHALGVYMLYASKAKWDVWPASLRQALVEGSKVAADFNNNALAEYEKVAFTKLRERGMTVLDVDAKAFEACGKPVWTKFDGELWDKGFMDRVQQQLETIRKVK